MLGAREIARLKGGDGVGDGLRLSGRGEASSANTMALGGCARMGAL